MEQDLWKLGEISYQYMMLISKPALPLSLFFNPRSVFSSPAPCKAEGRAVKGEPNQNKLLYAIPTE